MAETILVNCDYWTQSLDSNGDTVYMLQVSTQKRTPFNTFNLSSELTICDNTMASLLSRIGLTGDGDPVITYYWSGDYVIFVKVVQLLE